MTTTRHLTPAQRATLRTLANECELSELLVTMASIARHDMDNHGSADFGRAEAAHGLIISASRLAKESRIAK